MARHSGVYRKLLDTLDAEAESPPREFDRLLAKVVRPRSEMTGEERIQGLHNLPPFSLAYEWKRPDVQTEVKRLKSAGQPVERELVFLLAAEEDTWGNSGTMKDARYLATMAKPQMLELFPVLGGLAHATNTLTRLSEPEASVDLLPVVPPESFISTEDASEVGEMARGADLAESAE